MRLSILIIAAAILTSVAGVANAMNPVITPDGHYTECLASKQTNKLMRLTCQDNGLIMQLNIEYALEAMVYKVTPSQWKEMNAQAQYMHALMFGVFEKGHYGKKEAYAMYSIMQCTFYEDLMRKKIVGSALDTCMSKIAALERGAK